MTRFVTHSAQIEPRHLEVKRTERNSCHREPQVTALTWPEGSVERREDSELREEDEQGEDGSDFT